MENLRNHRKCFYLSIITDCIFTEKDTIRDILTIDLNKQKENCWSKVAEQETVSVT